MKKEKEKSEALTLDAIRKFLDERPLLSPTGLGKEAGICRTTLGKILRGREKRKLSKRSQTMLFPVFVKYGFKNK